MPARADLAPGTVLGGRFRVERALGAGTMGAVYEVEHVLTRHRRALKILDPGLHTHRETYERFQREASIAARIESLYLAEVFDAGTFENGVAYVLMELLTGESLEQLFSRRLPRPVVELARYVREAALGLHAAHEAGIVHRDVKPANLFVCDDGRIKVLDFGICQFEPDMTQLAVQTRDPTAMGTPAYMAPEQVRGERDLDGRVDVWALGAILYFGAAGVRPFRASTLQELAVAIDRGRRVPLAEVAPHLPSALVAIIDRAMAVERSDRYPSAAALAAALEPIVLRGAGADPTTTLDPHDPAVTLDSRELVTADPEPLVAPQRTVPPRRSIAKTIAVLSLAAVLAALAAVGIARRTPSVANAPSSAPLIASVVPSSTPAAVSVASSAPAAAPPLASAPLKPTATATTVPLHRDNPYQ